MSLNKMVLATRVPPLVRVRSLSSSSPNAKWQNENDPKWRLKWATGKDAKGEIHVGFTQGPYHDPVFHTFDLPRPPGKEYEKIYYREHPRKLSYLDWLMHKMSASVFFFWVFYNLYWRMPLITGEYQLPYGYEFTDEELGIPPDDAPDPTPDQYWGSHGKDQRNYR